MSFNDFVSKCAYEEKRLKLQTPQELNLTVVTHKKNSSSSSKPYSSNTKKSFKNKPFKRPFKKAFHRKEYKVGNTSQQKSRCFFCQDPSHFKKHCPKWKDWMKKKGNHPLALVCLEFNLVVVPPNSWWIDSGASVHISNYL